MWKQIREIWTIWKEVSILRKTKSAYLANKLLKQKQILKESEMQRKEVFTSFSSALQLLMQDYSSMFSQMKMKEKNRNLDADMEQILAYPVDLDPEKIADSMQKRGIRPERTVELISSITSAYPMNHSPSENQAKEDSQETLEQKREHFEEAKRAFIDSVLEQLPNPESITEIVDNRRIREHQSIRESIQRVLDNWIENTSENVFSMKKKSPEKTDSGSSAEENVIFSKNARNSTTDTVIISKNAEGTDIPLSRTSDNSVFCNRKNNDTNKIDLQKIISRALTEHVNQNLEKTNRKESHSVSEGMVKEPSKRKQPPKDKSTTQSLVYGLNIDQAIRKMTKINLEEISNVQQQIQEQLDERNKLCKKKDYLQQHLLKQQKEKEI